MISDIQKTLAIILLIFCLFGTTQVVMAGNGTGVDPILESVGLEKPAEWSAWTQQEKHSYLQERGIYPLVGSKYRGSADITGFFNWLGVTQPTDWDTMTFEEKKAFVEQAQQKSLEPSLTAVLLPTQTAAESPIVVGQTQEETISVLTTWYILIPSLLGFFLAGVGFFSGGVRSVGRWISYYGLPALLLGIAFIVPEQRYFAELGIWAERLLILLLFVKPFGVITGYHGLMKVVGYRRELGVASFWYFLVHAGGLFILKNLGISKIIATPYLLWGSVAGIGMCILAITSNTASVQYLKKNWKLLQYIAYPVLFAALAHSSLVTDGNLAKFYLVGGMFLCLKAWEWGRSIK